MNQLENDYASMGRKGKAVEFRHTVLSNGLELVAECNAHAQSVAVGFLVGAGSRDETDEISGVSHFLEHMVFKGTPRRSAMQVNLEFDEIGARYNAFTNEENTVFWAAVLPEYLPGAIDLLSDILRPSLRSEDFEMEKKVILEEIGMYEDQPGYSVHEECMKRYFGKHSLGRSVLGSNDSVGGLTQEQMLGYFQQQYCSGNIVVAVAGKVDWKELVSLVESRCSDWPAGKVERSCKAVNPGSGLHFMRKDNVAQEHLMQMAPAPSADTDDRFAADVLSAIVGDHTGSRIYWELVETGQVEMAEMGYQEFHGAGAYVTYVSCSPDQVEDNIRRLNKIYSSLCAHGISEEELVQAKGKIASRVVLRSERPMGRLMPLGFNWVYRREYRKVQEDLDRLGKITSKEIRRLLDDYPLSSWTTVGLGPLTGSEVSVS